MSLTLVQHQMTSLALLQEKKGLMGMKSRMLHWIANSSWCLESQALHNKLQRGILFIMQISAHKPWLCFYQYWAVWTYTNQILQYYTVLLPLSIGIKVKFLVSWQHWSCMLCMNWTSTEVFCTSFVQHTTPDCACVKYCMKMYSCGLTVCMPKSTICVCVSVYTCVKERLFVLACKGF